MEENPNRILRRHRHSDLLFRWREVPAGLRDWAELRSAESVATASGSRGRHPGRTRASRLEIAGRPETYRLDLEERPAVSGAFRKPRDLSTVGAGRQCEVTSHEQNRPHARRYSPVDY